MIVLKQSSEIIILKCCRIASFRLISAKIFLGEGTPLLQTPTLSAPSAPRYAACNGCVAFGDDYFDFAPPPQPKPETTSLAFRLSGPLFLT